MQQVKRAKPKVTDLISTTEAAQLLKVDVSTIRRMIRDGRLKRYARAIHTRGKPPALVDRREIDAMKHAVIEVEGDTAGDSDIA